MAAPQRPARPAAMRFLLIAVLIDMIAIGLIIPVLPHLIGTFTNSNESQAAWFGVVTFAFGAANFVASPMLGALSDRYGRRPVLLLGVAGLGLSFFVTAVATALWMLIVVRLFAGAMHANAAIAQAYVADITPANQRAQRLGAIGAMFGIGFILGPVIGGLLGAIDVRLPFVAAGVMAIANTLYGVFVLPESLPAERRRPLAWRSAHPLAAMKTLALNPGIGWLAVAIALATLAQFMLHSSWVLYTHFKFGWGPAEVGWSLFAVGAMSALVQGVLLKHVLKFVSPQKLAASGLFVGAATYLGFGLATQGWMLFGIIIAGNLLGGGAQAALQSIVSNAADPQRQGEVMGWVASVNSLMAVFAPVTAAPLLVLVSHRPPGDWLIGLPFYVCATLQFAAAVIAIRFFRRRASAAPQPASA